jgi:putative tryptophan/tyrosine transport system substrate-binding protein
MVVEGGWLHFPDVFWRLRLSVKVSKLLRKTVICGIAHPLSKHANLASARKAITRGGVVIFSIERRTLLTGLGGAALAWSHTARAQQPALPVVGFLGATTPSAQSQWTAAFVQRLHELGWIEGRNVAIEYRWAEGRSERFAEIAAEFVRLKVAVMVTPGGATLAAKQATSVIPIVFAAASDPVGSGLVASLARPGANVTGQSLQNTDLAGKRLELLREVLPNLRRMGIIADAGYSAAVLEMHEIQAAAHALGLEVATLEIRRGDDIAPAFDALKGKVDALYIVTDPLASTNRIRIDILALGARVPTISSQREFVEAGGLLSYGPSFQDMYRHAADLVDKILHGAKPADIPVEQPTKFELVINLTTAKVLGLTIPESFLVLGDKVIE